MPIFVLRVRADMDFGEAEGEFWPTDDTTWTIDVKQAAGDDVRKEVVVDPDEEQDIPNSKDAKANFIIKFEGDSKPSYLQCVKPKGLAFGRCTAGMAV